MLIDWFTVGAQLLNFIILVWLMKRFLYQPVLNAIAVREKKIASQLADAAKIKAEADQQRDEFQHKNQDFDQQRAVMLTQAKEAAKAEREHLQIQAREQADAASAERAKTLQVEAQHLHADIVQSTQAQVFEITRRVLGDLAGASVEKLMSEVFLQRLKALGAPEQATLAAALKQVSDTKPALLRSAFALPDSQQTEIQTALEAFFGQTIALKFEVTPELVCGIELRVQGQKLAWSISDYLSAVTSGLDERLGVKAAA